jgi:hypothetical protein
MTSRLALPNLGIEQFRRWSMIRFGLLQESVAIEAQMRLVDLVDHPFDRSVEGEPRGLEALETHDEFVDSDLGGQPQSGNRNRHAFEMRLELDRHPARRPASRQRACEQHDDRDATHRDAIRNRKQRSHESGEGAELADSKVVRPEQM